MSRKQKYIVLALVLTVLSVGGVKLILSAKGIPPDFTSARLQGAVIAQNIVNLSNQSTDDLAKVNEFDKQGNYTDALNLTSDLIKRSEDIRNQAVELSTQIETMTKALSSIDDLAARQAALESISARLALINRLINYSNDLGNLLSTLRDHFAGNVNVENYQQVQVLVNQINGEVTAINSFNSQAGQAMDRFDKIVNK